MSFRFDTESVKSAFVVAGSTQVKRKVRRKVGMEVKVKVKRKIKRKVGMEVKVNVKRIVQEEGQEGHDKS